MEIMRISRTLLLALCLLGIPYYVAGVPEFLGPNSRIAYIDENSPSGTFVMTVYASDPGGSASFTFHLTSTQFTIDSSTGVVTVAASPSPALDRETALSISITITLMSGGTQVDSLPVIVYLNDLNDNPPVWANSITSISTPFSENTPLGHLIYPIVVSDADLGSNADIHFRITAPADGTFAVDSQSGVVSLARPLDYDVANAYTITVIAEDQGTPSMSATISFSISVSPVVSAPPTLSRSHYFASINEGDYSTTNRNNIVTVVAVATNVPSSATIVYSLVMRGVTSDSLFTVSSNGAVNAVGVLDRETATSYDIQVQAIVTIPGMPNSGAGFALVTITVLDINDNPPVFENSHPNPIVLHENTPISTVIYTFYATDADEGSNGLITYELISPTNGPFSVGSISGVVHLTGALDYNTNPSYTITVQAMDGGSPQSTATSSLTITIGNIITAPPTFTENIYNFEVLEGSYTDHPVGIVRAVDAADPASQLIRYEQITKNDATDMLFSVTAIGTSAGRIAANGVLDRETADTYSISIKAFRVLSTSSTTPQTEASIVSVIIIVGDVNDNSPVWTSAFPGITLSESQPIGTDIFTATATDADAGSNGRITYSIVSPPANFPFSIDSTTGVIQLIRILDYDTQSSYTITVQAQDGGSTPRSITRPLSVTVQDHLDPPPTFTQSIYTFDVAEGTYANGLVGAVRAIDSLHPSAVIRYVKTSTNTLFTVTPSGAGAGAISLTGTVDADVDPRTYTIVIQAFRVTTGTTPRSDISTVSVVVNITDINDNVPIWTDPTPGPATITETRPIGTQVYAVTATDGDSGINGRITYSLPSPIDGPFSIGASTGIIRLTSLLDFTLRQQYNLNIQAEDGGGQSIAVTLIINVMDVLDPAPTFSESVYTEEILEGTYTAATVALVQATDPLSPSAVIRYEKVTTGDTLFSVSTAGIVTVTGTLDRETRDTYSISIRAFRVAAASSTTALSGVGIVSMLITVSDVNDNDPSFLNPTSTISVLENIAPGTTLYTFQTIDIDSGNNADVSYSIVAPTNSPLSIDSGTGALRLTGVLDYDLATSYALTIRAQDGGTPPRSVQTMFTVNVVDVLDPPPTFAQSSYSAEVDEGTYTNQLLETVRAVDSLHPTTAIIRYELVPKGDASDMLFSVVNSGTDAGQVLLSGTVSVAVDTYTINIIAFRVPSTSSTTERSQVGIVTMTITVADINNNRPVILNPVATPLNVLETRSVGSVLYTYRATDSDTGPSGVITFSLTPAGTPFTIEPTTGVLRLTSALDYDVQQMYTLTITTQDGGSTPLSDTTTLTVTVTDVVDPPPSFSMSQYTFTVNEGLLNVVVGQVVATDRESPGSVIIRYQQVTKGDATDALFDVEEVGTDAGEIEITAAANRELTDSYIISIRAFRVASMTSTTPISGVGVVSVVINIADVNDNPPQIINAPTEAISIFESRLVGSVIYTLYATDEDIGSNADLTYSITMPTNGPFSIGPTSGILRLTNSLDYDAVMSYSINVRVQDGGSPVMSASTTITVNVVDTLDPPPTFSESIYLVELNEGTSSASPIVTVEATDTLDPNANIRYELVTGAGQSTLFSVTNSGTNAGQVVLTGTLDKEGQRTTYTTNIRAFKVSSSTSTTPRSISSIVSVIVSVLDVNDNAPTWLNPITTIIQVPETAPIGSAIYTVIVSDADEGSNGRVTLSLTSPTDGSFAVSQDGVVSVNEQLDADSTSMYTLAITATDNGSPVLSASISLRVQVTAAAAPPPQFNRLVYAVSTPEANHMSTALHVTDVTAIPGTVGCTIRYQLLTRSDGSHSSFTVGQTSGSVDFSGVFDRETQRTWAIVISATEIDSSSMPKDTLPAYTTVIVTVTDVNDNPPAFITDHLYGSVPESARIGDVAAAGARAFDADEGTNAQFQYFLSPSASVPFSVDPVTGTVSVSGPLDYETTQDYEFMIVARETGTTPRLSSTATVNIVVVNENDNLPMFLQSSYTFPVAENLSPPSIVGTVTARDGDIGVFGSLTYTLVGFGVGDRFGIDRLTGVITNIAALNYEERSIYHLSVIASDGGGTLADPNRGTTQVVIQVLDVNDNTPVCFPASTTVLLEENQAYPNFLTISATDGDPPNSANSRLTFRITSSSSSFTISGTGQISAAALDYEAVSSHMYSLAVTASDSGNPSLTSSPCSVVVQIRDFNDLAPVFNPNIYAGSIVENHPVGTTVGVTVSATDPEPEHSVRYFTEVADAASRFFSVNQSSGQISLSQTVDYDPPANHRDFTFRVLAIDDATPPRTGVATITITVTPENDNAPIISNPPARDPFSYNIVEDLGTPLPFPMVTVVASDVDGDTLTYDFTTTDNHFAIDNSTGEITVVTSLDREQQAQHIITARACDTGSRCDTVTLTVNVTDYNDNRPMFRSSSLSTSASYPECGIEDQMVVTTLTAEDLIDLGDHREVQYTISGGDTTRFTVGAQTGIVRLVGPPQVNWDFETQANSYMITVRATDFPNGSPRLTSPMDATVMVTVTDCNDFPPVFSSDEYQLVLPERTSAATSNENVFSGISVTDGDLTAANSASVFSIVGAPASTNSWFGINPQTGVIYIMSGAIVDRENSFLQIDANGRGIMIFRVQALNGIFAVFATVTVIITDINDHNPVIEQTDPVRVSVVEHTPIGFLVTFISAVDIFDYDTNAQIVYNITSGNSDNKFAINTNTGAVTVAGDLDHEQTVGYTLSVEARENLGVPVSTPDTITIEITVVGANDHTPMFGQDDYSVNLQEYNAITMMTPVTAGQVVITVTATDLDDPTTLAGMLEYQILSGAMQFGVEMFSIPNPSSGAVTILQPNLLDYERQQRFELLIEVHDLATALNERRSNTTQLTVNIIDVNDNAPVFQDTSYTGSVTEEQPIGSTVLVTPVIAARDPDANGADPLTYILITSNPFNISEDGRVVRTTGRIDRESLVTQNYQYVITVQASDGASNTDTSTLTITALDINDNTPRFVSSIFTFAVTENRPVFPDPTATIGQVEAADYDHPNSPPITYYISGGGGGKFDVNPSNGEIYVSNPVNREEAEFYLMNITATDGQRSTTIEVTIVINDANDNSPIFSQTLYQGSIREDLPIGTTVDATFQVSGMDLRVNATDIDVNPVINYEVIEQGLPFTVHPETGYVFTNSLIDREVQEPYRFTIIATDGERDSLPAFIEIIVKDINDNNPSFTNNFYNTTIPERTPAGFVFLFLEAYDIDIGSNADITYNITMTDPGNTPNTFSISPRIGGISSDQEIQLNSQDPTVVTLTITASNPQSSLPPNVQERSDTAIVIINIVPINENAPQFDSRHYSFSINENEDNAAVGRVFANESDTDFGTNITYSILQSTTDVIFVIDTNTGEITATRALDREEEDLYQFVVSAVDNAVPPRLGFSTVDVRILDINDNIPMFDFDSYPVTLFENIAPNSSVDTLFATDADLGLNSQITYSIVSGNSSVFAINPRTGEVTTLLNLDRESLDYFELNISAEDAGNPSLESYVLMPIIVGDINDNNPIFRSGINQTYWLYENTMPPVNITTVFADDEDIDGNAHVVYSFEDFSLTKGPFSIDGATGKVTLTGNLDREAQDEYSVVVVASDLGGLRNVAVRSVPGIFTVIVLDRNDNLPVFGALSYEFRLREDSPVGTIFGNVSGTDADIGTNALLFYHMVVNDCSNTTCSEFVCIDIISGELTLRKMIDRERQVVYINTIAISNQRAIECDPSTREVSNATTAILSLIAVDANDEFPVFVNATLFAAVAEEAPFGSSVTRLEANDPDTGNGSVIWFATNSPEEPFSVSRESGDVTTTGNFKKQSGSSLEFEVRAFDNYGHPPSLSTNKTLTVLVFKCKEQVQLTFGQERETIEAKADSILEALTRVFISRRIIVTNINVKRTSSGTVDISGTDLTFFALDTETRAVINPTAIIRLIDENYELVRKVFEECRVEQIAIAPCPQLFPVPTGNPFPPWLWVVLTLLLLGLCCLCCCCIIVCVGERRKTRKYKKQVYNQTDYDFSMDQFSKSGFDNPVWVDPYPIDYDTETSITGHSLSNRDNPLYESQELTIEMFQEPLADEDAAQEQNAYESQELLVEMFSDNLSEPYSSTETLIQPPRRDAASPFHQNVDELDRALLGDDDNESTTSFV